MRTTQLKHAGWERDRWSMVKWSSYNIYGKICS